MTVTDKVYTGCAADAVTAKLTNQFQWIRL